MADNITKKLLILSLFIYQLYSLGCDVKIQSEVTSEINYEIVRIPRPRYCIESSYPSFSPNGARIAFSDKRIGKYFLSISIFDNDIFNNISYLDDRIFEKWTMSPNAEKIAYSSFNHNYIWILSLSDNSKERLTPNHISARNPAWSPDGKYLAFDNQEIYWEYQVWIVSATGGNERQVTSSVFSAKCRQPGWSPDGTEIAFSAYIDTNYQICTIPLEGGEAKQLTFEPLDHEYPSWSPDGTQIAYSYFEKEYHAKIGIVSVKTGEIIKLNNFGFDDAVFPSWSPDGEKIAFWADRGIRIFYIAENKLINIANDLKKVSPIWLSDGISVLFTDDTYYNVISAYNLINNENYVLTRWSGKSDTDPTWIDDTNIYFIRENKIWSVSYPEGEAKQFTEDSTIAAYNLVISPGKQMFIFDNGYDIFIQSIQGGDAINITNNISEKLTHPVFSPDGKQIACCTPYGLKFFSLKNNQLKETAFVTGNFTNPSWSIEDPDFGSHIAVESNESIYIISPEELKPELVISNNCQYPGWSPIDGKKLIYTYWGYIHISQIFQLIE